MNIARSKPFFISVLFVIILGVGIWVVLMWQGNQELQAPRLPPSPTTTKTSSKTEKAENSIQYTKREKIFEEVRILDKEGIGDVFNFYRIGVFRSGKYQGGDLILALLTYDGPCKGTGCGKPIRLRYARKDTDVIFLPKISSPENKPIGPGGSRTGGTNPFQKFGLRFSIDNDFTIPILAYPKIITGETSAKKIELPEYNMEEDGEFDPNKLDSVFHDKIFGDIYTTQLELAPTKSFYAEEGGMNTQDTVEGCVSVGCFTTNSFFVFRPDGTFLKYSLDPGFSAKDIIWNTPSTSNGDYDYTTHVGCSDERLDVNSVVPSALVSSNDLKEIGNLRKSGDSIYGLRDENHMLYREFYANYTKNFADWLQGEGTEYGERFGSTARSYEEFLSSRPFFLWRDPFGRLIRFNNADFLPPVMCEPVIYLYPTKTQEVTVTIKPQGGITASNPEYQNRWKVIANANGKIFNLSDEHAYPYLFWEGWSSIFPRQKNGFVVKQSQVHDFLSEILPRLGLNELETNDFVRAWVPRFSDAPYYFITFLSQDTINRLAPLEVSPKPDTVIRVLMDFQPLQLPIAVSSLTIPEAPKRNGFTVIEWGGLKR